MRKRSSSLKLTTMLAGATALTLSGCDDPGAQAGWDPNRGERVEAFSYKTLEECKAANEVSDQQCEASYAAAQRTTRRTPRASRPAPRPRTSSTPGDCVPRGEAGHGGFFTPLLTGFVIGRMLDGGGYYRGTSIAETTATIRPGADAWTATTARAAPSSPARGSIRPTSSATPRPRSRLARRWSPAAATAAGAAKRRFREASAARTPDHFCGPTLN